MNDFLAKLPNSTKSRPLPSHPDFSISAFQRFNFTHPPIFWPSGQATDRRNVIHLKNNFRGIRKFV